MAPLFDLLTGQVLFEALVGGLLIAAGLTVRRLAARASGRRRRPAVLGHPDDAESTTADPAPAWRATVDTVACVDLFATTLDPATPREGDAGLEASLNRDGLLALAAHFDSARRLCAARERVAEELHGLDPNAWHVEREVESGRGRLPFLLVGSAGVVGLHASDGRWDPGDFASLQRAAGRATAPLAGNAPVIGAVCLAFDALDPRFWHDAQTPGAPGGWLVGIDWLVWWLSNLPAVGAISASELELLRRESGPHWDRAVRARMPSTPRLG